jgi:hypothetical protein
LPHKYHHFLFKFQLNTSKDIPYLFSFESSWRISWGWSLGKVTIISTPIEIHDSSRRKKEIMNSSGAWEKYFISHLLASLFLMIMEWTLTRGGTLALLLSFLSNMWQALNQCFLKEQKPKNFIINRSRCKVQFHEKQCHLSSE